MQNNKGEQVGKRYYPNRLIRRLENEYEFVHLYPAILWTTPRLDNEFVFFRNISHLCHRKLTETKRRIPKSRSKSRNYNRNKNGCKISIKTLKKTELFGDSRYGKEFDDIELFSKNGLSNPKSIIIRKGCIIDNLTFEYNDFSAVHGGTGGSEEETMLEKDEYIVKVSGTYGKFGKEFLIETLSFTTNKGKEISTGQPNPGKENFEYKAEDGYAICALFGRADNYLNCIGFYSIKMDQGIKKNFLGGMLG